MKKETEIVVVENVGFVREHWFEAMLEEAKIVVQEFDVARVELNYSLASHMLEAKHKLGELLVTNKDKVPSFDALVNQTALALKISQREIQYCVKFYRTCPNVQKLLVNHPDGKKITWSGIISKHLTSGKKIDAEGCGHEDFRVIEVAICNKCGNRRTI